jgi:SAM-dependent methyltransferase
MDNEFIAKKVKELTPWYQSFKMGNVLTVQSKTSGVGLWNTVWKKYLPQSFEGLRVLDLGCNAGYFSIQTALLGAEVIGVELGKRFFQQAEFTKSYFEEEVGRPLNIQYIRSDIGSLDFPSLGTFDYIFALAVLYHIGKQKYGKYVPEAMKEQEMVIGELVKMSKNILVRTRYGSVNNVAHYSEIFGRFGFEPTNIIAQGKRSLVMYKG